MSEVTIDAGPDDTPTVVPLGAQSASAVSTDGQVVTIDAGPDDTPTVVPLGAQSASAVSTDGQVVIGGLDATGQPEGHVPTAQGDDTWEWAEQAGGGVQDTGARNVSDTVNSADFLPSWGSVTLQRWGSLVTVSVLAFTREWGPGSTTRRIIAIPAGFNPPSGGASGALSGGNGDWTLDASGGNVFMTAPTGTPLPTNGMQFTGSLTYLTHDPWPTTLPGTPA